MGQPSRSRALHVCLAIAPALLTTACSARVDAVDTSNIDQLVDEFVSGKANMDCYVTCSAKFGANQAAMRQMHDNGQWDGLAKLVITIGYDQDISWYYLGRSAEGLGLRKAAMTYYQKAINTKNKCNMMMINVCSGLSFPESINQRLSVINAQWKPPAG